jgi:tetratricopeptide (TPR) repeat protein
VTITRIGVGLAAAWLAALAGPAGAAGPGAAVRDLDGKPCELFSRSASANLIVFFRLQQEHSVEGLKAFAQCEREFAGKSVHWVAIAPSNAEDADIRAFVKETGIRMPVVRDAGDALYDQYGIRLHPYLVLLDSKGEVVVREPFHQINYCDRVRARIRYALREIDDAQLASVLEPPPSLTRTDAGVARRHYKYAKKLVDLGQAADALVEVEKSLAISPTADAYALRGQLLSGDGRCATAVASFDAALALEPTLAAAAEGRERCRKVAATGNRGAP